MKQIRFGIFETNSSSTHSLVIMSEQDYKDWVAGRKDYDMESHEMAEAYHIDEDDLTYEAQQLYEEEKGEFWKDWEELTATQKDKYRYKARKQLSEEHDSWYVKSYDEFVGDEYGEGDVREETFVNPDGSKVVAVSVYKYD